MTRWDEENSEENGRICNGKRLPKTTRKKRTFWIIPGKRSRQRDTFLYSPILQPVLLIALRLRDSLSAEWKCTWMAAKFFCSCEGAWWTNRSQLAWRGLLASRIYRTSPLLPRTWKKRKGKKRKQSDCESFQKRTTASFFSFFLLPAWCLEDWSSAQQRALAFPVNTWSLNAAPRLTMWQQQITAAFSPQVVTSYFAPNKWRESAFTSALAHWSAT